MAQQDNRLSFFFEGARHTDSVSSSSPRVSPSEGSPDHAVPDVMHLSLPATTGPKQLREFIDKVNKNVIGPGIYQEASLRIRGWSHVEAMQSTALFNALYFVLKDYPFGVTIEHDNGPFTKEEIQNYCRLLPVDLFVSAGEYQAAEFDALRYLVSQTNEDARRMLSSRQKANLNIFYDSDNVRTLRRIYRTMHYGGGKRPVKEVAELVNAREKAKTPTGADLNAENLVKVLKSYQNIFGACYPKPPDRVELADRLESSDLHPTDFLLKAVDTAGVPFKGYVEQKAVSSAPLQDMPLRIEVPVHAPQADPASDLRTHFRIRATPELRPGKRLLLEIKDRSMTTRLAAVIDTTELLDRGSLDIDLTNNPGLLPGFYGYQLCDAAALERHRTTQDKSAVLYRSLFDVFTIGADLFVDPEGKFEVVPTRAGTYAIREVAAEASDRR